MSRAMKDSGIPWIGKIPEGWETCRIKNKVSFNPSYTHPLENIEVSYMPMECLRFGEIEKRTALYEDVKGYTPFEEGDIVMAKVTPCFENGNIAVATGLKNGIGFGTSEIFVIRCVQSCYTRYVFYYLCTPYIISRGVSSMTGTGGLKRVNPKYFLDSILLIPPFAEQEAIAEFLDRKCGEVDEMVSLQEQVIEELKAYKQSVITEAVTKGLNPSAPMKPSNIDWIGQIPVEWDVVKLSLMTSKIGSGKTPTGGATIYTESGIMFLRSQNVYNECLKLDDVAFIPPSIDDTMANTRVTDGDVLLNITGGSIGRCYCINDKNIRANVNQHVCIIRPIIEKLYGKYLQYVINSNVIQTQIRLCQTGSNREELNFEHISNFKIPFMPVSMQREIADFLDRKCADIDALIALKQQKIEELKQYKKSLIYEYVTGKKAVPCGG